MRGIIYTRVSSDEQVKGTSLESQEEHCRAYCLQKGIEIAGVFRDEGESAKTTNRTEFLRALEFLRKNKGKVQTFVVLRLDRFARNTEDHFGVRKILTDYGVSLHSVTEPIGNNPAEKFIETVLAGAAQFENDIRRQRCTDGLIKKVDQGFWPWKPPVGYITSGSKRRGVRKTTPDTIDPETAPLIRRAFKEYLTGLYTQRAIAKKLDEWGLKTFRKGKTSPQFVDRLLSNPYYAGILVNPWTRKEVQGKHEPLITMGEFHKAQVIRSGRGHNFMAKRLKDHPEFPLRRTARCAECMGPLTGAWTKGRKERYAYYRCYNTKCSLAHIGLPRKQVEDDFVARLRSVSLTKDSLERLEKKVINVWETKHRTYALEAKSYEEQLEKLEERRKRICDMREEGSYSKEEFIERRQEVDNEITAVKISMSEANIEKHDVAGALSFAEQFLTDLSFGWLSVPDPLKTQFQKLVFPEGVPYRRNEGFGTAKLGTLFALFQPKTKTPDPDKPNQELLVGGAGFEPATSRLWASRAAGLLYPPT